MSKMSELATALDEMTEVGRTLITCGESLLKAAAHVRSCFTVGTNQVNFLRRNRYFFGLCVSGGTVPGKVVSPAKCLDRVEGYVQFLSDVCVTKILFPHLGYLSFLFLGHRAAPI